MKFATKWLSFVTLLALAITLTNCGGDDNEKSEEELQLDKLKGSWTMTSVENDDVDRSDEYPNMQITLGGNFVTGGTYNLTSEADDWPSVSPWNDDDTWKFNPSSISSMIVRQSDLQDMNYTLSNSDQNLRIEFNYSGPGFNNGRTASVSGNWVFTFTKN